MLITIDNPVGLDYSISQIQTQLHTGLLSKWGIDTSAYRCYPRCYRNKVTDGYTAENYEGSKEYREVYFDDSLSAISFFGLGETIRPSGHLELIDMHLVFFADCSKIKPSILHRADSEIRADVKSVIGIDCYGATFDSMQLHLSNVLREYPGSMRDKRLSIVDMQPLHCFRLNYKLQYDPYKNCTPFKN